MHRTELQARLPQEMHWPMVEIEAKLSHVQAGSAETKAKSQRPKPLR